MSSTSHYQYAAEQLAAFNKWLAKYPDVVARFEFEGIQWLQHYQTKLFADLKRGPDALRSLEVEKETPSLLAQRILLSGINWLAVGVAKARKIQVGIYSVDTVSGSDCDQRIKDVYRALEMPYIEVFHTVIGKRTWKQMLTRKRLGIYLEAISGKAHWYAPRCPTNATEIQRYLFTKVLTWHEQTLVRLPWLTARFNQLDLKVLLAIDDCRYHHMCVKAASNVGADTIVVQHGHFTKYHAGFIKNKDLPEQYVIPTVYCVWSKYWREELMRLGNQVPAKQLLVAGYQSHIVTEPVTISAGKPITIVIPFETDAPFKEVSPYIESLAKDQQYKVVIKLRADKSEREQMDMYTLSPEAREHISTYTNLSQSLPIDIVAGTYSTYLYDLALQGVRVVVFKTSLDYASDMIANGIATLVTLQQLPQQIETVILSPHTVVRERLLEGTEGMVMKDTVAKLVKRRI